MAPYQYIEKIIDDIVIKGKYTPPNEYMDLEYGQKQMQLAYNECASLDEDESILEDLIRWVEQAIELQQIKTDQEQAAMAMQGMPGMPPGMPGMPPEMMGMDAATQIPQESNAMGIPPEQMAGSQAMGQVL
jgi:hypothetical protein